MVKNYLDKIKKDNKRINAILQVNENAEKEKTKNGKLFGKAIIVKANINVKGLNASCASKVLENYVCPYDATVIEKIRKEGGVIIGMANMDEFACGSSGETSAFGATKNPVNEKLITGGSSSGSAAAVAADFCDMALGSDTGGSIRNPASHCGVVGVKPTYGSVSRYGLIDLSMSLDQIGPIAKNVSDAALLLRIIQGKDKRDSISQESKKINLENVEKIPKKLKVGVLDFKISDERSRAGCGRTRHNPSRSRQEIPLQPFGTRNLRIYRCAVFLFYRPERRSLKTPVHIVANDSINMPKSDRCREYHPQGGRFYLLYLCRYLL